MTPAIHIRRMRLSKFALRLRDEKIKILDVALDAGYESVDGYQRTFKESLDAIPNSLFILSCILPEFQFTVLFYIKQITI